AGDTGSGNLWGPDIAGSVNEKTGLLTIAFRAGHAPSSHALINVNYVQNGWGIGTGFLDEDDRPAHQGWMGTDWIAMSNANSNVKADMNTFLQQIAGQYFSTCRTQLKAVYPNVLYLGPDTLNTYGVPSAAPVMRAAGQYIDAFIAGNTNIFTQAEMDYIEQNYGDKPYLGSFYSEANPDSAMKAYPNLNSPVAFNTQAARGQAYVNLMTAQLQTAHTTAGNYPYIGVLFWEYFDNVGERLNWGLTTPSDNAYDGHEAVTAPVPCSAPIQAYTCGGESGNYGNLIISIKSAN